MQSEAAIGRLSERKQDLQDPRKRSTGMSLTLGLGVSKFEHLDSGQHCMNPTVPNGLFLWSGELARERERDILPTSELLICIAISICNVSISQCNGCDILRSDSNLEWVRTMVEMSQPPDI